MSAPTVDLALAETDPARFVLAVADDMQEEASHVSLGIGAFAGMTPEHGARLVAFLLATATQWRGVVERHGRYSDDGVGLVCAHCGYDWRCPDLGAVIAAARAYLTGGAA
jgi:hypothetical protein